MTQTVSTILAATTSTDVKILSVQIPTTAQAQGLRQGNIITIINVTHNNYNNHLQVLTPENCQHPMQY